MTGRKPAEGRRAEVRRLLASGMSQRAVADALGVNQSTVSRLAGDAASEPGRPERGGVDVERLRELRGRGLSWSEVARLTGVPKTVAYRRLARAEGEEAEVAELDTSFRNDA